MIIKYLMFDNKNKKQMNMVNFDNKLKKTKKINKICNRDGFIP